MGQVVEQPVELASHLKVRIDRDLSHQLRQYATERRLSISDAVRLLVRDGVEAAKGEPPAPELSALPAVGFANLIASEQVLALLGSRFPKSEDEAELHHQALEAARTLFLEVEQALAEPQQRRRPWAPGPRGLARFYRPARP